MKNKPQKIAVFLGGTSPEREVSLETGKAVYNTIKKLGYNVVLIDPAFGTNQPEDEEGFFDKRNSIEKSNSNYIKILNSHLIEDVDFVFLALHGKWGEDGTIQSLLELKGIKYSGSGVLSSALAMDKILSKTLFKTVNVNTADWIAIDKSYNPAELLSAIKNSIGFPCVVKPNDQGSTVGLTIAENDSTLIDAVNLALNFSGLVLIEKYIEGRELTVAVLDGKALPVLEIIPKDGFYDYEHKYTAGMSDYIVPANIPGSVFKEIQQLAVKAFNVLRCKVYARVDFRLNKDNIPYCLEVNTLPGMTSTSLVPKMAKAVGISFEELIEIIIDKSFNG